VAKKWGKKTREIIFLETQIAGTKNFGGKKSGESAKKRFL